MLATVQALLHLREKVDGYWRVYGRAFRTQAIAAAEGEAWVAESPQTRVFHITLVR
jgi:hypothetical protein